MARRVDVLNCKPEDLFLAVSQVEQQLAQKSLMTIGGRQKIPIQVLLTTRNPRHYFLFSLCKS